MKKINPKRQELKQTNKWTYIDSVGQLETMTGGGRSNSTHQESNTTQ